jgi:hypothetical protein
LWIVVRGHHVDRRNPLAMMRSFSAVVSLTRSENTS